MARPAPPALAFQDDNALMGPNRDALLDRIKRAGGKDIRTNVIYGRVKQQGYGAYDQLINAARARGLHVQATIMGTPRYSTHWDQTISPTSNDPRQWQAFANEVAKHFQGRVHRYSIGNEPNIDAFQKGSSADPVAGGRQYRNIYRYGRMGVKAVDPGAQVMIGELAPAMHAKDFLKGLFGGKALRAEGFAYHPYDQAGIKMRDGRNPYSTWDIDTLGDLQNTLASYAKRGKLRTAKGRQVPLYLTEFGYFGKPSGSKMSDGRRAAMMARGYRLAQEAGAKQLLQYQIAPSAIPADGGWTWDTSMDPGLLAANIRRSKAARAAKPRSVRKKY